MNETNAQEFLTRRIRPGESFEKLLEFPTYFEIETVNACNARCPMCTIADWTRKTPTMKMDLYRKIADEIIDRADHVKRVSLYRDGEPLLDKKMPDRIAILKEGGIKEVGISTNVSLLNEERSRALLESGLDMIVMSIDSLKKDIFEAIRLRLNFEEVMENAIRFIELRDRIRPSTRIWMRMIRQESNVDEWPAYQDFWRPKLASNDRVMYHNIHNWGGQLDGFKAIDESHELKLPCVALWSLMVIFGNGDVPLCNVDFLNKFPNGNVGESSIEELWKSHTMRLRRNLHTSNRKGEIPICQNCNVWDEPSDHEIPISSDYAAKTRVEAAE
jgi:radical SAM protein with 4Fe4S-binding SPASM domain